MYVLLFNKQKKDLIVGEILYKNKKEIIIQENSGSIYKQSLKGLSLKEFKSRLEINEKLREVLFSIKSAL